MLPGDPIMLMSVINCSLRDNYPSAEALFDDIDWGAEKMSRSDVEKKLLDAGYAYDREKNQYRLCL